MILPGLACRFQHHLTLGDVVGNRFLDVHILAREHGLNRGEGMPVVRCGDDHSVQVFAVEHRAIVARALGLIALLFLDAFHRLVGVFVIDVGNRNDLDVGLLEE